MAAEGEYDYDLVVIGGGSGGLACSREAAKLGAKVAVLDYVKPSTQGSTWGLGGTCVNVGCIPKKLYHTAGLLGDSLKDASEYGWQVPTGDGQPSHNWDALVDGVQNHIGSLNWGYRVALRDEKVEYRNELGRLVDAHTVEVTNRKKETSQITAANIVVCVGGRPSIPDDVPGAREHALTSDDIFGLYDPPGKTLVVGASYVALECAGYLTSLGYDTTVMVRSIFMRGFDQQIADMIGAYMEKHGTKIIRPATPQSIVKNEETGKLVVTYKNRETGEEGTEEYDNVFYATGRHADTANLNLEAVGVETNPRNGKIIVNEAEQTTVPSIYAIGDVIEQLELTPVAIKAGRLLAKRLFAEGTKLMDYNLVPTTVFTPLEYGAIGYSEEAALEKHGDDNIDVYHSFLTPLEWTVAHREENQVYAKLIVLRDSLQVIGLHYLGPNAAEVVQGYAVAMKLGATLEDFEDTVGIHPSISEELLGLTITKRSGEDPKKSGC